MEPHTRLMHGARKKILWMPALLIGVLCSIVCYRYDVHLIVPNKLHTSFTKDVSWTYQSPLWLTPCFIFGVIFTFFYFRIVTTHYKTKVRSFRSIGYCMSIIFSIACIKCSRTEWGQEVINNTLKDTFFAQILLREYQSIVFAFFVGTFGGTMVGILFGILGIFNIAVEGVIIGALLGITSGLTACYELSIHKDILTGVVNGTILMIINVFVNALCIAIVGIPLSLMQKISSISIDKNERQARAYRKRMSNR